MSIIFPSIAPSRSVRESSALTPPRTLITTLFSLSFAGEGLHYSTAQLIDLMADLGTDAAAVRSALMRLKQKGFLVVDKDGRGRIYRLAPEAREVLEESDLRVFGQRRSEKHEDWIMVVFSIPESEREKRHALRTLLVRLGFGNITSAVWISPMTMRNEARRALQRADLLCFVDMFEVKADSIDNLVVKLRSWWELDTMESLFNGFIQRWAEVRSKDLEDCTPPEKFKHYVLALTDWRKIAYLDPGIPVGFLPNRWPGLEAEALFQDITHATQEDARLHLANRLAFSDGRGNRGVTPLAG